MLSAAVATRRGPLLFAVLGLGLSAGLAFAAVGVALHAQGPTWPAALLFGAVGAACGMAAAVLRLAQEGVPPPLPVPMPAEELASLLRSTLAEAQRQRRATRVGVPADRRPEAAADAVPVAAAEAGPFAAIDQAVQHAALPASAVSPTSPTGRLGGPAGTQAVSAVLA